MQKSRPILLVAAVILLFPLVGGHASPNPLDVEQQILADESDDTYGRTGGFDISDVYVREARAAGSGTETGLVFRTFLYGGFTPTAVASTMSLEIDVTSDAGTQTLTATTIDGLLWDGASVVEQQFEAEGDVQQGYLQMYVSLDDLGAVVGDTVGPFVVRTFADSDLRDIAPGGIPVPGTGGQVIAPAESTVVRESIVIKGPVGYTKTTLTFQDGNGVAQLENLITVVGQHIVFRLEAPDGWTLTPAEPSPFPIEAGQDVRFEFKAVANQPDLEPAILKITSDLGGQELISISAESAQPPDSNGAEPTGNGDPQEHESPAGLFLTPGILLAFALLRRR